MNSKLAKAFAIILHPLLMPLYGTWLLLHSSSYLSFSIPSAFQNFIYLVVFISTAVMPLTSAFILMKQRKIESLEMHTREERHIPYIITLICYIASVYLLFRMPVPRIFAFMVGGGLLAISWALLVNLRWKVSIHMIGIGGLMGIMFGFARLFHVNMTTALIALAMLGGILAWARLKREAHTPSQIYAGFVGGFLIEYVYIWFFVKEILVTFN